MNKSTKQKLSELPLERQEKIHKRTEKIAKECAADFLNVSVEYLDKLIKTEKLKDLSIETLTKYKNR